jgi:hypothetical protein
MAKVSGVKEKLHMPLYDAFVVKPGSTFRGSMDDPRMIRFFVDVQNRTKLETNLQASGVLPSQNRFEARALRVVMSGPGQIPTGAPPDYASQILAELIYNSVTTLLVGEKIMVEAPTYLFPSGAGVSPGNGTITNHGEPDPMATFRFAEAVTVEPQQALRIEMLFPRGVPGDAGVPGILAKPGLPCGSGRFSMVTSPVTCSDGCWHGTDYPHAAEIHDEVFRRRRADAGDGHWPLRRGARRPRWQALSMGAGHRRTR